jgi:serine/threonine-protein kinase mTOR
MNFYSDVEPLLEALSSLRDGVKRSSAAHEVAQHMEAAVRELSLERFGNFEMGVYQAVFGMVHSDDVDERIGGVYALRALIDCSSAGIEQKVIRFANALGQALKTATDSTLIGIIGASLGHLARHTAVSNADYVEREMDRALEWLRSKNTYRLLAACAILREFSTTAPTTFFPRARDFFDCVWRPLCHEKVEIRYAAGKALSACLRMLRRRTYHLQWYCSVYDRMMVCTTNMIYMLCDVYGHNDMLFFKYR